jgi:hypothetical protein
MLRFAVWLAALCFAATAALSLAKQGKKECPECFSLLGDCANKTSTIDRLACAALTDVCQFIVCPVEKVVDHLPFSDDDGDHFSTEFGLRGAAWRGKDCDDNDINIYPGRRSPPGESRDVNCNGIRGSNSSGTFEDMLCGKSEPRGVVILSDSSGTHFGPPIYPFAGAC